MIKTHRMNAILILAGSLAFAGCGKDKKNGESAPQEEEASADEPQSDDAEPQIDEELTNLLVDCQKVGAETEVTTIGKAVDLINVLPKPVTIPCFLAALPRTYALAAVESAKSAQPATRETPRFFLAIENLIITVTGAGTGKDNVEFSEFDGAKKSTKGELTFPVEGELEANSPFAEIAEGKASSCAACHGAAKGGGKAAKDSTASEALRPAPEAILTVDEVATIKEGCDEDAGSNCQLVRAIFLNAEPKAYAFPESMKLYNPKAPKPAP